MRLASIIAIVLSAVLVSCGSSGESKSTSAEERSAPMPVVEGKPSYQIINNSFMGINAYDSISEHLDKLEKGKIRVGEKVKEVYMIKVNGNELGYVEPLKDAVAYVGNMTFNSPEVKTEEGIGVGSIFAEALAAYPKLKVKKSKVGDKVFGKVWEMFFILDYKTEQEKLFADSIPSTTKVTEVRIRTKKPKTK